MDYTGKAINGFSGVIKLGWNASGTKLAFYGFYLPYVVFALFRGQFISAVVYTILFILVFCCQYNWAKKMAKIN
jgi:hypothetical protein